MKSVSIAVSISPASASSSAATSGRSIRQVAFAVFALPDAAARFWSEYASSSGAMFVAARWSATFRSVRIHAGSISSESILSWICFASAASCGPVCLGAPRSSLSRRSSSRSGGTRASRRPGTAPSRAFMFVSRPRRTAIGCSRSYAARTFGYVLTAVSGSPRLSAAANAVDAACREPPTASSGRRGTSRPRSRRSDRPAARGSSSSVVGRGRRRRRGRRGVARGRLPAVVGALDFDLSPHAARPRRSSTQRRTAGTRIARKVAKCVRRR